MLRGLATAVIGTILLLAMLGIALGALLGDTELFNPATGAAQAKDMEAQTQLDVDLAQLELEQHREEIAAQQEAVELEAQHQVVIRAQAEKRGELELDHHETKLAEERAFLQRQYELQLQQQQQAFKWEMEMKELELQQQQQGFEQEMAMKELRQIVLLGVGSGIILVATLALAYYLYDLYTRGKAQQARQSATLVPRLPVIPEAGQVMPTYQDQHGGNGRGPRVRVHGQG